MVKSDFKNGMSFKTRYGDKCYIIDSKVYRNSDKDESILGLWGSLEECLESYDNELLVLHESPHGADIMEVYDIENNLIWERDEIDWSKIPRDTKVYVRQNQEDGWELRYFTKYENNKFYTYSNGRTFWSDSFVDLEKWNYCELAETEEPKKEVTLEYLREKHNKEHRKHSCTRCYYNKYDENCMFAWLLDNYNVTEK